MRNGRTRTGAEQAKIRRSLRDRSTRQHSRNSGERL